MKQRILGLDLGANSIGWAMLDYEDGEPQAIVQSGVRVFEAGMEGDLESGKEESRGKKRRDARQVRRQTERRARRHKRLANVLQQACLLPEGDLESGEKRHQFFQALDKQLREGSGCADAAAEVALAHVFPYWLRARALDAKLEPYALGRALYHLGQRRGFLSNRKVPDKDEDKSTVKKDINELQRLMKQADARTLGEYFAGLDPSDPKARRIRQRWTGRQMYVDEFEAIWAAQAEHHPDILTEVLRAKVSSAMFDQRPLKSQKHLIGRCELEFGRHRAPMALLDAQRFRLLEKVNDLEIVDADFREHKLTPEQRAVLLDALESQAELKFTKARKLLGLPARGYRFNFERGGEKRLVGNRTAAKLRKIFADRWDGFTKEEREQVVEDVLTFEKEEALAQRGRKHYGLEDEAARAFGQLELEPGYCNLSRQALAKVLPLMEEGERYMTARDTAYKEEAEHGREHIPDLVPPLFQAPLPDLRNPAVSRVLSELYRVVNAIIGKHGKPDIIRIELARDLKRSREARKRISRRNRENQKGRDKAAKRILDEMGNPNARRGDILRVLLAEECNWECPYTGKHISMGSLLGDASQFDIDHIIPFSRCLNDSYMNKVVCDNEVNRLKKGNRTPHEAFGGDEENWNRIIERVKRFKADVREAKLKRFRMESLESLDEFSSRQLNDTRYASTLAAKYLAVLYGSDYRRHIQVSAGQTTAQLRNAWKLNSILGDGGTKSRDDHRHHAVDAIAIALTDRKMVKSVSEAAQKAEHHAQLRWWKTVPLPWDSFLEDAQASIDAVLVSHRVSRKVNGPLHEETNYSPPRVDDDGKTYVHVRKPLHAMSPGDVRAIVDPAVRERVERKLDELGGPPKKAFADRKNHPCLETRDGRAMPIHKARIRKVLSPFSVGKGERERHVVSASNHHMEILEVPDKKGSVKWDGVIVTQYQAARRLRKGEPVVQRVHDEGKRFVFSIARGETIEVDDEQGEGRCLYVVRSVWEAGVVEFIRLSDARKMGDMRKAKQVKWEAPSVLQALNCRKVTITPVGEVRRAND